VKADDSQITPAAQAIEYITDPLIDPLIFAAIWAEHRKSAIISRRDRFLCYLLGAMGRIWRLNYERQTRGR
jgi:hypothetical protein